MAQFLRFPEGNPSVWDFTNFKNAWMSEKEWTAYMNELVMMGDVSAKTFMQYPSKLFVVFVPINIYAIEHPLGPHLVSFMVEVKGDVVSIKTDKIYRHGFIPSETYVSLLDKSLSWMDFLSNANNQMIDEIISNGTTKGPTLFFPLVNNYGELLHTMELWFSNISSK